MKTLLLTSTLFLLSFNLIAQKVAETIAYSGQQWYLDKKVKPVGNVIAVYSKPIIHYTPIGLSDQIIRVQWRKGLSNNHKWQYYYKALTTNHNVFHYLKYYNDPTIYQVNSKPKERYTTDFDQSEADEMVKIFVDQVLHRDLSVTYSSPKNKDAF